MTDLPLMDDTTRSRILADPDVLLEDGDIMRALVAANDRGKGSNVVDLRAIAMERLEARLGRLEDTHRSVIAAAYDNVAGTNQIHRAVLRLMEADDFDGLLRGLGGDVADILRVDAMRLILEGEAEAQGEPEDVLQIAPPGFIDAYVTGGRNLPVRGVTLRHCAGGDGLYGAGAARLRSEALLKLDFGHVGGLLAMGSEDAQLFTPQQGTDLLSFFAGVLERVARRWLT